MKLKLHLNDADLLAMRQLLFTAIRRNPLDHLRSEPTDYLIVVELTEIYLKVDDRLRRLEWFGSTRSTQGKVISLTLTHAQALAFYVLLMPDQPDSTSLGVDVPLPIGNTALTYETDLLQRLAGIIHRQYFI